MAAAGARQAMSILRSAVPEPDDQQFGDWPRERLLRVNERFIARLERAIAAGDESRQAAAATHGASPTLPR